MTAPSRAIARLAPALLYAALAAFANPAHAAEPAGDNTSDLTAELTAEDRAALDALREGDMRKLVVLGEALPAPDVAFTAPDGSETTLFASNGRVRLVNFWATWCAPCREEMPALDALAAAKGGADFAVILVATGRNAPEAIERFMTESNVDLPTALDPKGKLAAAMQVPGLPVTVVLDRGGREVARLMGGADWDSESARAIVDYLVARDGR